MDPNMSVSLVEETNGIENPVEIDPQVTASPEDGSVHIDVDHRPHLLGIIPHISRERIGFATLEAIERIRTHNLLSCGNIIWSLLVGWWVALSSAIIGCLLILTHVARDYGWFCIRYAKYIAYPFGKYAHYNHELLQVQPSRLSTLIWYGALAFLSIPIFLGIAVSWELIYFLPMAKHLFVSLKMCLNDPTSVVFDYLVDNDPKDDDSPLMVVLSSGSSASFRFNLFSLDIVYLNLIPFVILALACEFLAPHGSWLDDPLLGSVAAMFGAVPCAYVIGVCVDDLSHQLGLILGSIINAVFITLVELILYTFSLLKGLADIVRSAIVGAFLMNLLIIPGCSMFAAGLKWNEVVMNKRAQSVSGTFLLLAITAVLFPSVFYHGHSIHHQACQTCIALGNLTNGTAMNCTFCTSLEPDDLTEDPIYIRYAEPLMITMAIIMPIIYFIGVFFSLKTHAHIFKYERAGEGESKESVQMSKTSAIVGLLVATAFFSMMAHVMTEKIPRAIEKLGFSSRFVGLIFYTLIPNLAEYMNAIKFSLKGNIGLAMEVGNQAAILTALIELPATVLISYAVHSSTHQKLFTLVFPITDIFCILIAVLLRNSILTEKSVNYFTGLAFLLIFLLIAVVYYYDFF